MSNEHTRRDFLKLFTVGGVVLASGLPGVARARGKSAVARDFFFLQLSDTHWGFRGPPNPQADVTLKKTIATINSVGARPDFVVFTGDLTQTTDDVLVRKKRMTEFKEIIGALEVKNIKLMPGEHDASLDEGATYKEFFGATHYSFDHKGVHFVVIDNVSDPAAAVGDAQIDWLAADLKKVGKEAPIVVFTHRPLFDLYPQWDWATKDGSKVVDVLLGYKHVTVFYGHIHQENHHATEHIEHHAARALVFPLPPPGSQPKRTPLPWKAEHPFSGLGYRSVTVEPYHGEAKLAELPVERG